MPTYKNCVEVRPAAQLWHYTSLDALKKILKSQKLRLRRIDTYWKDEKITTGLNRKACLGDDLPWRQ